MIWLAVAIALIILAFVHFGAALILAVLVLLVLAIEAALDS